MGFFSAFFSKPLSTTLTVSSGNGFHLRPVAQFVSVAKQYRSEINASFNGKTVDAKGVNALLSLSLEQDDTFTLICKGKDAVQASEALKEKFSSLMEEDVEVVSIEKETTRYEAETEDAEIIFSGIAIAPVYHYCEEQIQKENTLSFEEALEKASEELHKLYSQNKEKNNADIFLAQKELLASLKQEAANLPSLEENIQHASKQLYGTKLEAKVTDYKDILHRVKKHLGMETKVTFPEDAFILFANDLLPSQIEQLKETKIAAVVLKETSLNSHTAILLRGEGIISVIADASVREEDTEIIIDAHAGLIVKEPSEEDLAKASKRQEEDVEAADLAQEKRFESAVTPSGKSIKVLANVTDVSSAKTAKEEGAEGIGLLRTEFLFKAEKPSFEMQRDAYSQIFEVFDEITVRTLDVGGDKALPYIDLIQEENPFLGIRGVRLFNTHPEIIEEQLHAIFAAANNKPLKVMFPMVSSVEEFKEAKIFAQNVAKKHQVEISNIRFGIMVEVPSVLFLLEAFNEVVDFYSIGTNDLTQYLFAIERTHATLKTNDLSPAVFDAIKIIVEKSDKPVSICGELAANEKAIPKLLEIGMKTLSVSVKNIAKTKELIRHV